MTREDEAYQAVADGNEAELRRLLDADPALARATHGDDGFSLLLWAAMYGDNARTTSHREVVDLLVAAGAEVDIFAAAYLDRPQRAAELLQADPSLAGATAWLGWTALHLAADRGAAEVARLLLAHGADPDALDRVGRTPLDYAAHPGPWKPAAAGDVVSLLRQHGATVSVFQAAGIGDRDLVRSILDTDPSLVGARDAAGATALYHAAKNLHLETVRLLLERGAGPNAACADGQTPLSAARTHAWDVGGPEVVRLLESAGP